MNNLRWFGVLPQTVIQYGEGITIDLSSDVDFDEVVLNITEELKTFHPSVKYEHKLNGDSYGHVRKAQVLTLAEAHARGFKRQKSPRMLYLGAEPLKPGDLERAEFASVGLYKNVLDEHNKSWPWWLGELSVTDNPHIRHEQTPASELNKIKFTAKTLQLRLSMENIFMEDTTQAPAAPVAPAAPSGELEAVKAELEAVKAELIAVKAERDALKTELDALKEVELDKEADVAVDELELSAHLRPAFKAMYIRDRTSFNLAAAGLHEAKTPGVQPTNPNYHVTLSARQSKVDPNKAPKSKEEVYRLAASYRSKQAALGNAITHAQAFAAVR